MIQGRGQYYKNYQNIALTNIGVIQPGQQANIGHFMTSAHQNEAQKIDHLQASYQTDFQANLELNEENRKPFNIAAINGLKGTGTGSGVSDIDAQNSFLESQKLAVNNHVQTSVANHTLSRLDSATNSQYGGNSMYGTNQTQKPMRKTNVLTGATSTSY